MRVPPARAAITLAVLVDLTTPRLASPQPSSPLQPIQRLDVTTAVGTFTSRHAESAPYDRWGTSGVATITGGYYWTDHLKTEIEVGWTGHREVYGSTPPPPGVPPFYQTFVEHTFRSALLSVGQVWQGGRNAWAHPFVAAGVSVDRHVHVLDRPQQLFPLTTSPGAPTRLVQPFTRTDTAVRTRPWTMGGFKAYFTERGFFRSDLRFGIDGGVHQVAWRAGVGVDF